MFFTFFTRFPSSQSCTAIIGPPAPSEWRVFPLVSLIVGEILDIVRGSRLCVASLLNFSLGRILQGSYFIFLGEIPQNFCRTGLGHSFCCLRNQQFSCPIYGLLAAVVTSGGIHSFDSRFGYQAPEQQYQWLRCKPTALQLYLRVAVHLKLCGRKMPLLLDFCA